MKGRVAIVLPRPGIREEPIVEVAGLLLGVEGDGERLRYFVKMYCHPFADGGRKSAFHLAEDCAPIRLGDWARASDGAR
eukprot:3382886-Pyramimonas_sp.AAC.1